jgi:two-component system, NarL family, sensor kinase
MRMKRRAGKSAVQALKRLRARVNELEETLMAINRGRVDALVVNGPLGDQVFTLQGAEHPYRVLVETMIDGAATLDADGTVLYANISFARILGVSLEDVIGKALREQCASWEQEKLQALIDDALRGESKGEFILISSTGQRRLVRFSLSPVDDFDRRTICVVATDLTELSGANEALKASEDMLRNLSGRLLRLQDEERRRISRDLHDVTGQKLALLSMDLSASLRNIPKDTDVHALLLESLALSNEVNKEIRTLSYVLHPPLLDELGLSSAVQWFTQGFENRTGIRVSVDIPSGFVRLAPDAEVTLFRIVQESLANVHRYSGSATAFVRATSESGRVKLEIGDFGKGMRHESKTPGSPPMVALGVGIQGMKERVRQLAGTLEITSEPDKGTRVTAILPIVNRAEVSGADAGILESRPQAMPVVEADRWRKRILIADDHDVLRRGIRTMLESEPGLEVCGEAVDGKDAIEKTLTEAPDLVILDINMPILNGLDVVRQIVRHRPQTKILAFSVHDSEQIVEEIMAAGAHGYLSKATAGQNLVHEVNQLLNQRFESQLAPEGPLN